MKDMDLVLTALVAKSLSQHQDTKECVASLNESAHSFLNKIETATKHLSDLSARHDDLKNELEKILQNDKLRYAANLDEIKVLEELWSRELE